MSFQNIFDFAAEAAIAAAAESERAHERAKSITIDGATASLSENTLWRGFGMVSANNSSRLLLDYKSEAPERYNEIMNYIFGADGLAVSHLKIEMGSDVNSSSGTEPCAMRFEDEKPDVTRGAGFQLAADAKKINPALTLDMLWWSEPRWVSDSHDDLTARYKWYRELLVAAYEEYGLKFDYVSANRNERAVDADWIKYLSYALKNDADTPYDFSEIKIVASDEENSWYTAQKMLDDKELLAAIDVIGSHYTSHSTPEVKKLISEHNKEAWFSEACPPMSYEGTYRHDSTGTGLADMNGMLDIANRIITMYPEGGMTLHELQPVVAAYYDGACYCQKQMILANEPWSGWYRLDGGFFMGLHFSQFIGKGWAFVDSACFADGAKSSDGHAIVDAVFSYITATDTESGDYSFVATNSTAAPITYTFDVKNLGKAHSPVYVWETRGPDNGAYDENYFKLIDTVVPETNEDGSTFTCTIKPYSLVTISTLNKMRPVMFVPALKEEHRLLKLPYRDDFAYALRKADFLSDRGGAPLYTTDQGGAFEVVQLSGRNVLKQKITENMRAEEWGYTPKPMTCLGDDRWLNYSVSCEVKLADSGNKHCYAGCGLRYNLASSGNSGWWLKLCSDGTWSLNKNRKSYASGSVELNEWNTLKISAERNIISAWINGTLVAQLNGKKEGIVLQAAGRAALYSSYHENCFAELLIEPINDAVSYVKRIDCTDAEFSYSGEWTHKTMDSFKNYNRTCTSGIEGASAVIKFRGMGIMLLGANIEGGVVSVELDGVKSDKEYTLSETDYREAFWSVFGLRDGEHTLKLTVESGTLTLDAAEAVLGDIGEEIFDDDIDEEVLADDAIDEVLGDEIDEAVLNDIETAEAEETAPVSEEPAEEVAYPLTVCEKHSESLAVAEVDSKKTSFRKLIPIIAAAGAVVAAGVALGVLLSRRKNK